MDHPLYSHNVIEYDKTQSDAYAKESIFIICGYTEDFFDSDGKILSTYKHPQIPLNRTVASDGEMQFTLDKDFTFTRDKNKIRKLKKGEKVTSVIYPICGRRKPTAK